MQIKKPSTFLLPMLIAALVLISIIVRYYSLPVRTMDMEALLNWYRFILKNGFVDAFKENFAIYTPPYLYMLAMATAIDGWTSRVTTIKLISIFFDILCAIFVYKIVWLKYAQTRIPLLAAALMFALPTVMLNSAYWGQCDSIYTAFLLACLYFLLTERPVWAILFFGLAFSFKLQAMFLFPFLAAYTLRKKIPWFSYLLVPVTYIVLAIPTIMTGRPWRSVMTVYMAQAEKHPRWAPTTPTLYTFLEQARTPITQTLTLMALILAAIIVSVWVILAWKKRETDTHGSMLVAALASVGMVPFILPQMHQRYFYPQDVIALVVAFYRPKLWFLPVLSQIVSIIAYAPYLFNLRLTIPIVNLDALVYLALPLEILLLSVIMWKQFRSPTIKTA